VVVLSQTKSVLVFILGNTWSDKMSNQKRIGLEGTIKAYAGCSRIIATVQRASSTELPAESGEKRRRAVPVKVRPFCASTQQKNAHFH
jgi:hypothetical protein